MRAAVVLLMLAVAGLTPSPVVGRSTGTAVECVGYQDGGHPSGAAHIVVSSPNAGSSAFEIRHLDLDRTVLWVEQFTLGSTGSLEVAIGTRNMAYAAQILSVDDLSVSSYVTAEGAGGDARLEIACTGPGTRQ